MATNLIHFVAANQQGVACNASVTASPVTDVATRVNCVACLLAMNPPKRGPLNSYKVEAIAKLATEIMAAGFRVFIAESGTYGVYCDALGTRVVSFQCDLGGFKFSGNYRSKSCGTGWGLGETYETSPEGFRTMFQSHPPQWATRGEVVELHSLVQHLRIYQSSSRYAEVVAGGVQ